MGQFLGLAASTPAASSELALETTALPRGFLHVRDQQDWRTSVYDTLCFAEQRPARWQLLWQQNSAAHPPRPSEYGSKAFEQAIDTCPRRTPDKSATCD